MNFKMKTLVAAALATVAMSSGSAFAIGAGETSSVNGTPAKPSEMFLMAYDSGSKLTFLASLGATANFTGTSNLTNNFAGDANWNTFKNAGISAASTNYQVFALDTIAKKLWTTSNTENAANPTGVGADFSQLASVNGFNLEWMTSTQYNGNPFTTKLVSAGVNGEYAQWGDHLSNAIVQLNTVAALGEDNQFHMLAKVGTRNITPLNWTDYMQTDGVTPASWNLNSAGQLSFNVTAVPEANTWAMMLAGLGLMGFVARRRA